MVKKYYTPEIEEFHPGFEFEEQKEPGKWAWNTCHPNTFEKLYDWDSMDMLKIRTRVKHLDQQDIEDLGFKPLTEIMWNNGDWTITLVGRKTENPHYKITNSTYSSWVVFQGTIKNKSELKRILKQIRYYDK